MKIHREYLDDYWAFIRKEIQPLLFGINFTFLSSFGQTFLLSLFVPHFIAHFDLTKTDFGTIYSVLTLLSATCIPILGGWIDQIPLKLYSLLVILGLILGSLTTALSGHLPVLIVGLFLLRLSGQGLSTHTAMTSIGRIYDRERGKGLSLINLGLPLGEGMLPLIVAGLLTAISWRWTFGLIAIMVGFIFLPIQMYFLNISQLSNDSHKSSARDSARAKDGKLFNPRQLLVYFSVMAQRQFWLIMPAVILPAFWITGLFLYQTTLSDQFGWSVQLLATTFVAYGIARIIFSLGIGPLIDRFSARKLFPFYLLPMGLGLLFAYFHPGQWSAFAYMSLLGITMGAGSSIKTALWAELYELKILGRVRSLFSSLMVFSTSLSPILLGWLLDQGFSFQTIVAWALLSILLAMTASILELIPGREKNQEEI